MKFEVQGDNPKAGNVTFEDNEFALVTQAILNTLLQSATDGGTQLLESDPIRVLASALLKPKKTLINNPNVKVRGFTAAQLESISDVVKNTTENLLFDQAKEVGGLIAQLEVASKVLKLNAELDAPNTADIDRLIEGFVVPDSLDGLV